MHLLIANIELGYQKTLYLFKRIKFRGSSYIKISLEDIFLA